MKQESGRRQPENPLPLGRGVVNRHIRSQHDIESAIAYIRDLDATKRWEISIKPAKSRRSLSQNRLLWLWNSQIQLHMREHFGEIGSAEDWHEVLVSRLLPTRVVVFFGEPVHCRTQTRKLSVADMSAYLELLEMYCAENLGLQLARPEDIYWEALLREKTNA